MIVAKETVSDLLYRSGKPVLELYIEYPQVDGPYSKTAESSFNAFYKNKAKFENRKARIYTYRRVVNEYNMAKKECFPFMVNSFRSTFEVAFVSDEYISLIFDFYTFSGGAHGETVRTADTWNMKKGRRVTLKELFPECTDKKVTDEVKRQIKASDGGDYFENAVCAAEKYYDPSDFYLSDGGVYVFYPLYALAPHSAGFKNFRIL